MEFTHEQISEIISEITNGFVSALELIESRRDEIPAGQLTKKPFPVMKIAVTA